MSGEKQTVAGAYGKIEAHEELCAERYKNIHGRLNDVRSKQDRHELAMWALVVSVLGFLAVQAYQDLKPPPPAAVAIAAPSR